MTSTYASEAGHWYYSVNTDKPGEPCHEVMGKTTKRMRPTTKWDARRLDLVPSVSGIIRSAAADTLVNWLQNQVADTCYENQRLPSETKEAYRARVRQIDQEARDKVPALGSRIHACIEKHLKGESYDQTYRDHVVGALDCLGDWCGLDNLLPERSFAHPLGYGGKCDIHKCVAPFPGFVADFKSKDFGEDEFPQAYDNHTMQLSAYREGFQMPNARGAIIFVSTQIPGLTRLVEVSQDELEKGWRMFCALLDYWKAKNGFETERN